MSSTSGGQPGNTNAAKGKVWNDALRKAITQDNHKRVREAIEQLLNLAAAGEQWAIKELADRLDGKAAQPVTGADGESDLTITHIIRQIVDPIEPT